MMRNKSYVLVLGLLVWLMSASAGVSYAMPSYVYSLGDTTMVADVADTSSVQQDSLYLQMFSQQQDTVKKEKDRGYDAGRYVNIRRQRSVDLTPFVSQKFMDNTFVSLRATTLKLASEDYSFGMQGGLSVGKWLHEDHGVRVNIDCGTWTDNFDVSPITGMELSASYLFNLTSYVGGYRTNRLAEIFIVAGAGYSNSMLSKRTGAEMGTLRVGHAFTGHVGANLNLRLFRNFDFFVEPQAVLYTNGMAVSYAGNWRSWMAAFRASFGLTYNISPSPSPDSYRLLPRTDGWFVTVLGGPHFQNSEMVYTRLGADNALGVHGAIGLGKYYTEYFAVRYTASFCRGSWREYDGEEMPCNYFTARAEAMIDAVGLVKLAINAPGARKKAAKATGRSGASSASDAAGGAGASGARSRKLSGRLSERRPFFSASLLIGPEIGYMHKVDQTLVVATPYIGLTGGIQAKFNLTPRFSLFAEPRFSLLPYDAPANDPTTLNDNRNYYDSILNFNLGIEFLL